MAEAVDRLEVRRVPGGRGEEADRQVGAGAVEANRVEAPFGEACRRAVEDARSLAPRRHGVVAVEPADVRDLLPEAVVRLVGVELRVDERAPGARRRRGHAPVRRALVDDLAGAGQVGQHVPSGPRRVDPVERVRRGRAVEGHACRVLGGEPVEALHEPRRDVLQRRLVGVREALALHPRVEGDDVDAARAPLVRGTCDLARERLLAGVGRDADDLAGLDVRAVSDDEVGEPARELGVVVHGSERTGENGARCD